MNVNKINFYIYMIGFAFGSGLVVTGLAAGIGWIFAAGVFKKICLIGALGILAIGPATCTNCVGFEILRRYKERTLPQYLPDDTSRPVDCPYAPLDQDLEQVKRIADVNNRKVSYQKDYGIGPFTDHLSGLY